MISSNLATKTTLRTVRRKVSPIPKYTGPVKEDQYKIQSMKPSEALVWLYENKYLEGIETILDYGSGRYPANADYLREKGFRVYAYDPKFGSTKYDGWDIGQSATVIRPSLHFDLGISIFVLNCVKFDDESKILRQIHERCDQRYHITQNLDLFNFVKENLIKGDTRTSLHFVEQFSNREQKLAYGKNQLSDKDIMDFCKYGVDTRSGFQRYTDLSNRNFRVIKKHANYLIFKKPDNV